MVVVVRSALLNMGILLSVFGEDFVLTSLHFLFDVFAFMDHSFLKMI